MELTRCEVEALLEISSEMKNKKSLKNVTITADYDIICQYKTDSPQKRSKFFLKFQAKKTQTQNLTFRTLKNFNPEFCEIMSFF